MRRVLKHHVCFCFLSTALLAGVSLIAAQEKVYAGSQGNCKGAVDTGSDGEQPIVCNGRERGDASDKVLRGDRNIDMSNYIGMPAVEVRGGADIMMSGTLRVTNTGDRGSSGRNDNQPAIKVESEGKLTLVNAIVEKVHKGIVADGGFVTVMAGSIKIKDGGDAVIEVKNKGKVTLNNRVAVIKGQGGSSTGITGIEVGDGGGTVELMDTSFTNVKTGIMIKGAGEGKASATVMNVKIVGKGGETSKGVVMIGEGTVELNKVTVESFSTGVEIKSGTSGTVTLTGGSKIVTTVENGVGIKIEGGSGKLEIFGESTIEAKGQKAVGIKITEGNGSVTMMGGKIVGKGDGSGQGIGVDMAGEGTVELTKVTVLGFETGVKVSKGKVTISGESAITAKGQNAVGVEVKGTGVLKIEGSSTKITATGNNGVGIKITGGKAEVTGGEISIGGVFNNGATMGVSVSGTGSAELMNVKIKGNGKGTSTGVVVDTSATEEVKLTDVDISEVMYGVSVSKGKVMISGESKIAGISTGLSVQGGTVTMTRGTISEGGVYMSGGTLTLEDVTVSGSSTGVTMSGGTFKMIRGSIKGNGNVVNVTGGEKAELTNVKIVGSGNGNGVYMAGKGEVTLEDVEIEGVTTGVSVSEEASGTLTVKKGEIKEFKTSGVSVEATGDVTVNLDGTKITGSGGGTSKGVSVGREVTGAVTLTDVTVSQVGTGVYVKGGKSLTLTDVTVSEVATGVQMLGGKKLTMERGSITVVENSGVGVSVEAAGVESVSLEGTKIIGKGGGNGDGRSKGLSVGREVTGAVTLKDVTISEVATGVYVMGGKSLTMTKGSIGFTRSYGVYVGGEMTAKLTKTVITGSGGGNGGTGVYATGGEVTLTDVTVSQVGTGVQMLGGKKLTMERGEIKEFTTAGVSVGISVTRADLTGTIITGKGSGTGVKVEDRATASLTLTDVMVSEVATGVEMKAGNDLTISGGMIKGVQTGIDMSGSGALMISGSSTIEFTSDNGYGVYVGKKVTRADLRNVTVTGKGGGQGVYVAHEGKVAMTLADVKIERVGTGVRMMGGNDLTVTKGSITNVQIGVVMMGDGALTVSGTTEINFAGGYGVYVGGEVTKADLTETKIRGKGGGTGVYVAHEGKVAMTLADVNISEVTTGLYMMGNGALTVSGNSTTINFAGGYGVYVGSSVKSATLTKTKIMGKGGGQGVYVAGGKVTLTDVMVSKVGIGVQMMGAGSLTMNGTTEIQFAGNYGVYVGGEVTRAELTKTVIRGEGNGSEYGVYAGDKVMGEVTMTTITGRRSHEVRGALRGRTVRLEGVQISGVQKGVHVTGGGTLTMNQGSIEFKGNGYGVYVGKGVTKADLTNVTVTGKDNKGVGVYAMGGRTMVMTLTDVKISGVGMGIFAAGGGMLAIGGTSTIGFQGKYGVYVGKDVMGEVAMTTITGSGEAVRSGTGVYVNGGAAWLGGTTLKSVAKGMTVENGIVVMQNGVIKFHGEHGVLLKQGNALLVNVGMKYEGNNADATFLKVDATEGVNKADIKGALIEIDGQGKGLGVHVMNGGRCSILIALNK
ncbi:hypothetical protein BWD121_000940 [Bartonella sp. WD12.1]|nr:hypothetical protein BWD121_000940 [Bartonella sp. WD12.1]